jgi:hypothetical protein
VTREPRGRARRSEPPSGAQRRWGWKRVFPAVIALVLMLGGTRALISLRHRPRAAAPPAPAARDPAAGMSTIEAAGNAARLYRANRAYQSLPYYRRVAPEMPPGQLDFGLEFATALQTASLGARVRSEERVRLMRECLEELGRVEGAVRQPRERARAMVARAFFLRVWGFPVDAAAELERALAIDPSYPGLAATARLMEKSVREPTLPLDALEGPTLTY